MSSKKKWLIGCGAVLLIAILTVVGVLGFITYKVSTFGQKITAGMAQIENTNTKHAFTRPVGDVMDPARLKVYFDVRDSVVTTAMNNPVFKKIQANDKNNPPGFIEMISAVLDFMQKGIYEYSAQLDKHSMSLNEYRYYSMMTYLTVKHGEESGDATMSEIARKWDPEFSKMNVELAKNPEARGISVAPMDVESSLGGVAEPFPQENIATVAPYKDTLIKNSFGSFFEVFGSMMLDKKVEEMKRQGSPIQVKPMPTPAQ